MSAREFDNNGFMEVKGNPLSKVGVFPYLGKSIGIPGLEPEKVYNVYRPESELSNQETINSFKLIPWVDEHEMIGVGYTPAEQKGVEGVVGEEVYYEDGYLRGNIKLFSQSLSEKIDFEDKKELSCGYSCKYELAVGEFDGQLYDIIQTDIRGNHLALVDKGRMGKEVSVLDKSDGIALDHYNITFDKNRGSVMDEETKKKMAEMQKTIDTQAKKLDEYDKSAKDAEEAKKADEDKKAKDMEEEEKAKKAKDMEEEEGKKGQDEKIKEQGEKINAQDSKIGDLQKALEEQKSNGVQTVMKEIKTRDTLAEELSDHVGVFDHSEMTTIEVAKYGLDKLEIEAEDGSEVAMIKGFLLNREKKQPTFVSAQDKSEGESQIDAHLFGKKD